MIYYIDDELGVDPIVDGIFDSIKKHFMNFGVQVTGKVPKDILDNDGKIDKKKLFTEPPDIVLIDMIQHADRIEPGMGRNFGVHLIEKINEMHWTNPPELIIITQYFLVYSDYKDKIKIKNVSYFMYKLELLTFSHMNHFLEILEEILRKRGVIK